MNLNIQQIDQLKIDRIITQVIPSRDIVDNISTIDELKDYNFITLTDSSINIANKISLELGIALWDYIWDEESWNTSYENGVLKEYYKWSDKANAPYKEDLWNTVYHRAANINDARKNPDTGEYVLDENGNYIYDNCVRCWEGALNAPGAKYPWCAIYLPVPFEGIIKFVYEDKTAYPWGEDTRIFNKGFAIASIPTELGDEYLLIDGETIFDPKKLTVFFK